MIISSLIETIDTLHIQNFKSVKDLQVECGRINLLLGEPNTGKSNILEARALYPRIEDWIFNLCRVNKIDITKYGLPNYPGRLKRIINNSLPKLSSLIDDLVKTPHIRTLISHTDDHQTLSSETL